MPWISTPTEPAGLQAQTREEQYGPTQIFKAPNGSLYYVAREQMVDWNNPPVDPPFFQNIIHVYKSADGVNWADVGSWPYDFEAGVEAYNYTTPACMFGTKIYIADIFNHPEVIPHNDEFMLRVFDTADDSTSRTPSWTVPEFGDYSNLVVPDLFAINVLNDGTILAHINTISASYFTIDPPVAHTVQKRRLVLKWDGAVWSELVVMESYEGTPIDPVLFFIGVPLQQIHDPVSDLSFLFFRKPGGDPFPSSAVQCAVLQPDGTYNNVDVHDDTFGVFSGMPGISIKRNMVFLPFPDYPQKLYVARATIENVPEFSIELVEDISDLPGTFVTTYDQTAPTACGSLIIEVSDDGKISILHNTYDPLTFIPIFGFTIDGCHTFWITNSKLIPGLYAIYVTTNELDNADSQCWLYARRFLNPGWSDRILINQSDLQREPLIPFAIASAVTPPSSGYEPILSHFYPVSLPRLTYLDNTGAKRDCFPMRRKRQC